MADNQFSVKVPSAMESLMGFDKSFDQQRGYNKERETMAGRQEAARLLAGGDQQGAIARLMGMGDIQGAQVVSGMGNTKFDQNYKTQSLELQRQALNKRDIPSGFHATPGGLAPIAGGPADPVYKKLVGDRQNAPPGYKWADPTDQNAGLQPIPGGPAEKVDAEVAARIGLGRSFLGQLPAIRERIEAGEATGAVDAVFGKMSQPTPGFLGGGDPGEVHRQIASGAEALLRNLTGAGMNKDEAAEYVKRYRPSLLDDSKTLISKVDQLERELNSVMETVGRGRGGTLQPVPAGGQPSAPAAGSAPSGGAKRAIPDGLANEAKKAIAEGRDPAGVKAKLESKGFDTSGLGF